MHIYNYNYRTWLQDIHSQSTTSSNTSSNKSSNIHKNEFGKDSINYTIVSANMPINYNYTDTCKTPCDVHMHPHRLLCLKMNLAQIVKNCYGI